jgi:hypothetical protein
MTRFLLPLRLILAVILFTVLPNANADVSPSSLSDAQSPPNDFLLDFETLRTDAALSETGGACTPVVAALFPLAPGMIPTGCEAADTVNLNATSSADSRLTEAMFLLPVLMPAQPSDGEPFLVRPAESAPPSREPNSLWVLLAVSTAIALIVPCFWFLVSGFWFSTGRQRETRN